MATVDQARFYNLNGLNLQEMINNLAGWFRMQDFDWRVIPEANGRFVLQIKKQSTGRAILGLNYALTVVFTPQAEDRVLVELGGTDWTDKLVSGAVGVLFVAPLILTAGYGAWQQSELNYRVWDFIESYVLQRSGKPAYGTPATPYYSGMPDYSANTPPPPNNYYPSSYYPQPYPQPGQGGFPTAPSAPVAPSQPAATSNRPSWFDTQTMQPVFSQQIQRMASWQEAMADGKIVDTEIAAQKERVEKKRKEVEGHLDYDQRLKLAEVLAAMERLEAAQIAAS